MSLNNLKPAKGSNKTSGKRLGRGQGSDDIQALITNKKIKKDLTIDKMVELRLAKKGDLIKILGRGNIDEAVNVTAHKFSASAEKLIEKVGGKIIKI